MAPSNPMRFQNEKLLLNRLKGYVDRRSQPYNLAVFDADGTLWPEDVNDILLDYEIQKGMDLKPLLSDRLKGEGMRATRCRLFASLQAGLSLKEFKGFCVEALSRKRLHVFPFQKELLEHLKQRAFKIIVVTASVKPLVETAIQLYDLPVDLVLGVETEIKGGYLGKKVLEPSPVAHLKGEVLLQHSQGEKPFLSGGNTLTDLPLLEMAQRAFVVHSAVQGTPIFLSEKKLVEKAVEKGWEVFHASRT